MQNIKKALISPCDECFSQTCRYCLSCSLMSNKPKLSFWNVWLFYFFSIIMCEGKRLFYSLIESLNSEYGSCSGCALDLRSHRFYESLAAAASLFLTCTALTRSCSEFPEMKVTSDGDELEQYADPHTSTEYVRAWYFNRIIKKKNNSAPISK